MENYHKDRTINHKVINPFSDLLADCDICKVQVSEYSQVNKVLGYAIRKIRHPDVKVMIVHGQGKAIKKVSSCAQILMTKHDNVHRCDAMSYKIHEDIWKPKDEKSDLDTLSVKRHIPALFVLLAKDELPSSIQAHPQRLQLKNATKPRTKSISTS